MFRLTAFWAGWLALAPAADAQDAKDKAKDDSPAAQYKALVKEYQTAMEAFQKALQGAKTQEEKQQLFKEKYPRPDALAPRFLALAEKHPKDAAALDALVWIVTNRSDLTKGKDTRAKAAAMLLRDHVESERMGQLCESFGFSLDRGDADLLRAILDKNPKAEVQAEACLALMRNLHQRSEMAKRIQDDPKSAQLYESYLGKETLAEFKKLDLGKLAAERAELNGQLVKKHLPAIKVDRLAMMLQRFTYGADKEGEALARLVLEKDGRPEAKGVAALTLGQILKKRADDVAAKDAKEGAKIRREAETLLEQAADKYGDMKIDFGSTTVGQKAKSELYEIRHLAVGLVAPEVEGVDQDGKTFKLSDYKGKVVLLDFWSQH